MHADHLHISDDFHQTVLLFVQSHKPQGPLFERSGGRGGNPYLHVMNGNHLELCDA